MQLVSKDPDTGLELWETKIGRFWVASPGHDEIEWLQWEQIVQKIYDHTSVHVQPGDVVIDCGAHVGVFTRLALQMGARLVVAVEPEKTNLIAFQKNFAQELINGKVKLVKAGVWDKEGRLSLHLSKVSDSHTLLSQGNSRGDETIDVTTIDVLFRTLKLPRVDFIKMDIEGSERNALRGARGVLARWRPRLAISSYHQKGDPAAICGIVWDARSDYQVVSKDLVQPEKREVVPKVLFFF